MAKANAIELSKTQQQHAVAAIEAFAKTEGELKKATDSASAHVLKLFQYALKQDKTKVLDIFGALCRHAERVYSENHSQDIKKLEPISKLLPFWRVAKSQVLNAYRGEVDMTKVKSVYEAQKEVKAKKRASNAGGKAGDKAGTVTLSGPLAKAVEGFYKTVQELFLRETDTVKAHAAELIIKCDAELRGLMVEQSEPADDKGEGEEQTRETAEAA